MDKFLWKKWIQVKLFSLVIFAIASFLLYLRGGTYDLSSINKAVAYVAVILAGISLTIGPLSRKIFPLGKYLSYRRQLGLAAFLYGLAHVILSLFFLPSRFPVKWYLDEKIPVIFGIIAILTWIYLAFISRDTKVAKMGGGLWARRQQIGGHLAFLAIYLHLIILKYNFWILWITGQTKPSKTAIAPGLPPTNIIVFFLMTLLILYRLTLFIKAKLKK